MGVKGLWTLLSASGRCIPLDAVTSRVLAIDVSLWLVQFLKAMRNENGEVRQDAHLIGMFKRICRLLLFGIRPVFVFDGPPPMLKRKTLALRRRLRDTSELRWQRTAEKILLTQLKLKTMQQLREQLQSSERCSVDPEEFKEIADSVEIECLDQATQDEFADMFKSDDEDGNDIAIVNRDIIDGREIVVPESFDTMDPEALAALPYSMQFEVLEKLREDRAHESRVKHIASANAPSTFSSTQLNQFLETSAFNRKINDIRSKVGGDPAQIPSQGIATMPDTLFYFHKPPSTRKSGKRERQELLRAAIRVEKPAVSLSDFHMDAWSCLRCGLSNLAIRRSCQNCGQGYGQEPCSWNCSVCSAVNLETNTHCSSCQQIRKIEEQSSVPEVLDRTAEVDAFFDDDVSDIESVTLFEQPSLDVQTVVAQEIYLSETALEGEPMPSQNLLTIRNSRLNFYKLQRQSSLTYSQESSSRYELTSSTAAPECSHEISSAPASIPCSRSSDENVTTSISYNDADVVVLSDTSDFEDDSTTKIQNSTDVICEIGISPTIRSEPQEYSDDLGNVVLVSNSQEISAEQEELLVDASEELHQNLPSFSPIQSATELDGSLLCESSSPPAVPPASVLIPIEAAHDSEYTTSSFCETAAEEPESLSVALEASESQAPSNHYPSSGVADSSLRSRVPLSLSMDDSESKTIEDLAELRSAQKRNLRDADHVTDDMIHETQSLLRLFGIPFVRAPAEAEAQCAALELLGIVDGVVTDDSDVFLFGARNVYRNMFSSDKTVERYQMADIERELGVDREKLIEMALLLGSDYTDGIHGIGIVNAIEIVNSFDSLREFREWVYSHESDESEVSKTNDEDDEERDVRLRKFKATHRNIRRNWQVPRDFPNEEVISTYLQPPVDKSDERFTWGQLDVFNLQQFCQEHLQWRPEKTDGLLAPVVRKLQDSSYQTRLEAYFGKGEKAARIQSKRIKLAVNELTSSKTK